ncbi:choline-phosphate cytidylyltransferase A-like [Bolinopsis microptera]|uniref:choline-phosphate cytidylyltransferase A-like n=1 Tax=Bolinopsis microptera TaxID=2820187 RepID=UPI003079BBC2
MCADLNVVQEGNRLPAVQLGESVQEYSNKYGMYINPADRTKYKHIKGKDQIRVYVDGVFDMFHFGHARYIMQAKNMFPNTYVIAGVSAGSTTLELKGQTVMTEEERCESVRQCRYVDEVICPAPWCINKEFLHEHNIDFVVQNDAPYPMGDNPDIYKPIKDAGMFLPVIRTNSVSTSDYITRIIAEYDKYLQRNLERGYSRHDLGITFLKEKRLEVRRRVEGVHKAINGYIADFMEYFYEPISHRIVDFISPQNSLQNSPVASDVSDQEDEEDGTESKSKKQKAED